MQLEASSKLTVSLLVRLTVTCGIFLFLIVYFDLIKRLKELLDLSIFSVILALSLVTATLFLNALRWWLVIPIVGGQMQLVRAGELTFVGHFFNQVLPTSVGGDVIRVWEAHRDGMTLEVAGVGVATDRIIGLVGLLLLIVAAQPFLFLRLEAAPIIALTVLLIGLVAVLGLAAVLLFHRLRLPFEKSRILRAFRDLSEVFSRALVSPARLGLGLAFSVCMHLLVLVAAMTFARDLGIEIPFFDVALILPTVLLIASLPLSLGGWGAREAGLAAGFAVLGYPAEQAIQISVMIGLTNLILGLPGTVLWLLARRQTNASAPPEPEKR
jgi:hypothetical protein